MSARAALDAARAQFTAVVGQPPVAPADASALWSAAESTLQQALGRPDLSGQALVGDARRVQALTLADAHALVTLQGWVDRLHDGVSIDLAQSWSAGAANVVQDALTAMEHAVQYQERLVVPVAARTIAPPVATVAPNEAAAAWQAAGRERPTPFLRTGRGLVTVGIVVTLTVFGARRWWDYRTQRQLDDAIALYANGHISEARTQLTAFEVAHPDDARPRIYLGRIAREARDFVIAREQLQSATRLAPTNAIAHRELAATLLADGEPEIARRFYVRAVELDPSDRLAQGFLACALHRLGRDAEALRWVDRAGVGEWSACIASAAPPSSSVPPK